MQHVLCTGNIITKANEEYLRTLAANCHFTRGDLDIAAGAFIHSSKLTICYCYFTIIIVFIITASICCIMLVYI